MVDAHAERIISIIVPDWPVVAARIDPAQPAAVFVANRVIAANAAARAEGIDNHMRRRSAQQRCPELTVLSRDPAREARAFEVLVTALEAVTPRVEIPRPGRCAFAARGPTRYFGGEPAVCARIVELADAALEGHGRAQIGIAEGPFAASRAARMATGAPLIVVPGATPEFLAGLSIDALGRPEFVEILQRLGLSTLGAFAALKAHDVSGRFGADGLVAWRLARGLDHRPIGAIDPPDDLTLRVDLDPPAVHTEAAMFVVRGMADQFVDRIGTEGLSCTRLVISAETVHGELIERSWAHDSASVAPLTAGAIAQRLRWQLEGWLGTGIATSRLIGGISRLSLIPESLHPATGRQLGLWGGASREAERVTQAMARVQGLLGDDAVCVPTYVGGRSPSDRWSLVPLSSVDPGERTVAIDDRPWPGRLPTPSPSLVLPETGWRCELRGADGQSLWVTGRGEISDTPTQLIVAGTAHHIAHWAGPWPCEERWWDPVRGRRRARLQVLDTDQTAWLVTVEAGLWRVEAIWD